MSITRKKREFFNGLKNLNVEEKSLSPGAWNCNAKGSPTDKMAIWRSIISVAHVAYARRAKGVEIITRADCSETPRNIRLSSAPWRSTTNHLLVCGAERNSEQEKMQAMQGTSKSHR